MPATYETMHESLLRGDPFQKVRGKRVNVRIRKVSVGDQKSIVDRAVEAIDDNVEIEPTAKFAGGHPSPEHLGHGVPARLNPAKPECLLEIVVILRLAQQMAQRSAARAVSYVRFLIDSLAADLTSVSRL
jgi:hypothetical protein